jgi:hypothetical protein
MKPKFLTLLLAAGALTAACSNDDDNTGFEVLGDVPYLTASDYLDVPAGNLNLKAKAAGTNTTVVDADLSLVDGTYYTVIATGLAEATEPMVLQDDDGEPAVDIYVIAPGADLETAIPLLANVEFGDVADYIEAPAGDYQVRVAPTGTRSVVIDSGIPTLSNGQARTTIAVDAARGAAPFGLLVLEDPN